MYSLISTQLDRLDQKTSGSDSVIPWACPVPFFGGADTAVIATVGINPSNREFTDEAGSELGDATRRLPTLASLGLKRWGDADSRHVRAVADACASYFRARPYDRWFQVLERLLRPSGVSFYGVKPTACHIDVVPFATGEKWGALAQSERRRLLATNNESLGHLVRATTASVLVLNGRSVVDAFVTASLANLDKSLMAAWDLPRSVGACVPGIAYSGTVAEIGGVDLGRLVRVVGYNHNLQSSFGVTGSAVAAIGSWLAEVVGSPSQ